MNKIVKLKPIGIIHTPYKEPKGMPIQGKFDRAVKGKVELLPQYTPGLQDIKGFSHLILIYYFHRIKEEKVVCKPFLEDVVHGVFAVRSPYRPNRIGLSVVKLESVKKNILIFSEVDMLDGTPLLDVKPYVEHFDSRKNVKSGWVDKHFKNGKVSTRIKIK